MSADAKFLNTVLVNESSNGIKYITTKNFIMDYKNNSI